LRGGLLLALGVFFEVCIAYYELPPLREESLSYKITIENLHFIRKLILRTVLRVEKEHQIELALPSSLWTFDFFLIYFLICIDIANGK
jgi:hypothetical protein